MTIQYYLGLDGGGSHAEAAAIDPDGRELARGRGGPCNIASTSPEEVQHSVREALGNLRTNLGAGGSSCLGACAGVAGYSAMERRAVFAAYFETVSGAAVSTVEPDYVIAYWGATHGEPGIVIIAGTGAVAYGRNARGDEAREDGLGYLLGDRGSGFNLGIRVLQHAIAQVQSAEMDGLAAAVLEATGANTYWELIQWTYGSFSPRRIAALAPVVGRLASEGEPAAVTHITEMAHHLRRAVRQIRYQLWLPWDVPVYPMGGLWEISDLLRSEFRLPSSGYGEDEGEGNSSKQELSTVAPRSDAAYGAALLARELQPPA